MKFNTQHTFKVTEVKRWKMPSVGKDMKSLELSYPAARSVNWYSHSGNCKYQQRVNVCIPCDPGIMCLAVHPTGSVCICSPEPLCQNVNNSTIHDSSKLETVQMPNKSRINKWWNIHTVGSVQR